MEETELRDVIFSELLAIQRDRTVRAEQQNFGFMKESINKPTNKDGQGRYKYNESQLSTIFKGTRQRLSWIDNNDGGIDQASLEEGLLVTTASKPDMAILRHVVPDTTLRRGKRKRSPAQIVHHEATFSDLTMGEFKHSDQYTIENVWVQCAYYLLANLYWQRVKEGVPPHMSTVFFCVALSAKETPTTIKRYTPSA